MPTCKRTGTGAATGLALDQDAFARLDAIKGDALYIGRHDPEFERQMTLAEQIMADDCAILQGLAGTAR